MNDKGDVMLLDKEKNTIVWVPNNTISFNNLNQPQLRQVVPSQRDRDNNNKSPQPGTSNADDVEDEEPDTLQVEYVNKDDALVVNDQMKTVWTQNSTLALITAVEARYDDMFHINKRKKFWAIVSQDLMSESVVFTEKQCKKKWENLVRSYKSCKDNRTKTGRGPIKFSYYDRLEELLGDSPANSSPHTFDSGYLDQQVANWSATEEVPTSDAAESSRASTAATPRKRKNSGTHTTHYLEAKKTYCETKAVLSQQYVEESLQIKKEKLALLKKKIEIEERKSKALEQLVNAN